MPTFELDRTIIPYADHHEFDLALFMVKQLGFGAALVARWAREFAININLLRVILTGVANSPQLPNPRRSPR
jgi:hypothetical protein